MVFAECEAGLRSTNPYQPETIGNWGMGDDFSADHGKLEPEEWIRTTPGRLPQRRSDASVAGVLVILLVLLAQESLIQSFLDPNHLRPSPRAGDISRTWQRPAP